MVHIHLNQKITKMLIDESKLQLIVQLNFLNGKKQHTHLKLRTFYLRLKTKQIVSEEITPLKLIAIHQLRSHTTQNKPITDTQSRRNYLQN